MNPGSEKLEVWVEPLDALLASQSPSFLQSSYWAEHKSRFGWTSRVFTVMWRSGGGAVAKPDAGPGSPDAVAAEGDSTAEAPASFPLVVLLRTAGPGLTLAYVPHGPGWSGVQTLDPTLQGEFLLLLGRALTPYLLSRTFLLRFDPDWPQTEFDIHGRPNYRGLKKGPSDIQPPDTVILDLTPSLEEILAQTKSKHRYNIRLAQKKDVQVREVRAIDSGGSDVLPWQEELEKWYALYEETALRDKIAIHSYEYYRRGFETFPRVEGRSIVLLQAYHEGDYLAGIVVILWGTRATYLYGASSNLKRNLMPAYALQWRAIELAKATGCREYDLFGIPPENNADHPMYGLYQFKTGFGGSTVHYPGTWDLILKPWIYRIYLGFEFLRKFRVKLRKR